MHDSDPNRRTPLLLATAALAGILYLGAHLFLTAGEVPPSTTPAPGAGRHAEGEPLSADLSTAPRPRLGADGMPLPGALGGPSPEGIASAAAVPTTAPAPPPPFREADTHVTADRPIAVELQAHGASPVAVNELVAALAPLFDFRHAQLGHHYQFTIRTADGRVTKFRYETGPLEVFEVERAADGTLKAHKVEVPVRTEVAEIGAELKASLYQAMKRANESPALVSRLVDAFAWDLDFYKDPRPGDSFKVLVEKIYSGDKFIKYGHMLAAEYVSKKRGTFQVFYFSPEVKPKSGVDPPAGGYFLQDGQSAKKTFLKTPLKFARVSSKFDLHRKHPILHYTRAHLGVDFAAKTGTPVWSMAGGVIRQAAFERGFGNLVIVDHRNGLLSFYAHLSRFAKGMKPGVKVEQKQVVGFVGMTGLATGPHLHFGVKRNGAWVDPAGLKMTRDAPVPSKYMAQFRKQSAVLRARLAKMGVKKAAAPEPDDDTADGTDDGNDDPNDTPSAPEAANAATVAPPLHAPQPASAAR